MEDNKKMDPTLMTTVFVLVVLGLIIAWFAFNNNDTVDPLTDRDVTAQRVEKNTTEEINGVDKTSQDVAAAKLLAVRAEARTELRALETKIKADKNYAKTEADLNAIEAKLDTAYANATAEAKEDYVQIKLELNDMEVAAKAGASGILDSFTDMIALLNE